MRKLVSCLLVAFFVVSMSSLSYARGPFITPGARAAGYGTAFVSIADDLTAIYWNPAGLAYQKNTQIMVTSFYISANATSDSSAPLNRKYETSALIPFIGFSTPFDETTTVAFGVYAAGGGGGKFSNVESLYGAGYKIEGENSFMVYNVSIAKVINDQLSIGIGVEGIEMKDKLVFKIPSYPDVDYARSAFGFQGNIGIMYKPVDKLSTGFILRSGTYIGLPEEPAAAPFVNGYTYPMTMELGASYNVLDPLTVAFAVAYNKYSWTSDEYKDTVQFRVGTEYKATDKLALHLGLFTDPNIYKNSDNGNYYIGNIDMYNMQYFCIGAEYAVTEAMNLGLTYTHSFTQDVVDSGTTYEYPGDMARFDIGYKF